MSYTDRMMALNLEIEYREQSIPQKSIGILPESM
jgi:hypothetical protein